MRQARSEPCLWDSARGSTARSPGNRAPGDVQGALRPVCSGAHAPLNVPFRGPRPEHAPFCLCPPGRPANRPLTPPPHPPSPASRSHPGMGASLSFAAGGRGDAQMQDEWKRGGGRAGAPLSPPRPGLGPPPLEEAQEAVPRGLDSGSLSGCAPRWPREMFFVSPRSPGE